MRPNLNPGPFHHALTALRTAGQALLARIAPARAYLIPPPIIPPTPRIPTPADRIAHALAWLAALTRVLAGDPYYRHPIAFPRFPGRYPALTADIRASIGLPPVPPRTEAQRQASRLHHMRKTFATIPTKTIAARLARRLGLEPKDAVVLLLIEEPPAEIGKLWERRRKARPGALPPPSPHWDPAGAPGPRPLYLRRAVLPAPS